MYYQLALSCLSIALIVCYRVYIRTKAYPNDTTTQVILGDGMFNFFTNKYNQSKLKKTFSFIDILQCHIWSFAKFCKIHIIIIIVFFRIIREILKRCTNLLR